MKSNLTTVLSSFTGCLSSNLAANEYARPRVACNPQEERERQFSLPTSVYSEPRGYKPR